MRTFSPVRACGAVTAFVVILGGQVIALADDKPAGEMWQESMTMEMAGMNMNIPARTMQVCAPAGKADEALSKPQGPGMGDNCTMQDAKREGNKFTAKFICTGKQAMQGNVETIFDGSHSKTTMTMAMSSGQTMTMKIEGTKLGTACTPGTTPGSSQGPRRRDLQ